MKLKSKQVNKLNGIISSLDGIGPDRAQWAAKRNRTRLETEMKELANIVEGLKPERLKELEKEKSALLAGYDTMTRDEFSNLMRDWKNFEEYAKLNLEFLESAKYKEFLEQPSGIDIYELVLTQADIKAYGKNLNQTVMDALELICPNFEAAFEEYFGEKKPEKKKK